MTANKIIFFTLILSFNIGLLQALDLSSTFNIGNLGFSSNNTSSTPHVIWGVSVTGKEDISDSIAFSGSVINDEISGNRLDSRLIFKSTYVIVGIGPSIATFNNGQLQPKPAINAIATVQKEGVFFLTSEIYSTFGNLSDPANDYSQLETSIALGFNVPNAICTFSFRNKQYTQFHTDSSALVAKTTDLQTLYQMEADIHKKNIPFHLLITLGFKSIQRLFPSNDPAERSLAGIGSAFIGVGTIVKISKTLVLQAGIDSGLYNFSLSEELTPEELPLYLFNTFLTATYTF